MNLSLFDTRQIKAITPAELTEYEKLVAGAKAAKADESKAARERWIEKRIAEELAKHPDATEDQKSHIAATYKGAARHRILHADFILYTLDGRAFTVADALADPDKYDGAYIRDPLEPFGENSRARLHLKTAGRPCIYSFYQQATFTLSRTREKLQIIPGSRVDAVERLLRVVKGTGFLFQRGGEIVSVTDGGAIRYLDTPELQYILDGLVMGQKFDARAGGLVPKDIPANYAEGLAVTARLNGGLPEIKGVVSYPTMDPRTGRIIDRYGYDKQTGLLLQANGEDWPTIPNRPTKDEARRAFAALLDPFIHFPFAGPVDRGVYLGAIITAVNRVLLETAPMILIAAPEKGTGKTLLARCLARLVRIMYPAMFPFGGLDEAEIRKRLLAIFMTGTAVTILDNLKTGSVFTSESICMALTNPTYSDRVLSVSKIISAPTNTLMIATGNNVRPGDDLCRRTTKMELNAGLEKPWKRNFDENILERIDRDRPLLIAAALTALRGTLESGFTVPDGLGSFEDWNRTARAAVCYAAEMGFDVADPVLSIETSMDDDPETGKLRALLAAWFEVFGDAPATVAACISAANEYYNLDFNNSGMTRRHPALYDAADEIAGDRGGLNIRILSRWIERHRDRIIDGMSFDLTDKRTDGAKHWRVKINF